MKRGHESFIHNYVWKGQLSTLGGSDEWKTYSRDEMPFRPTAAHAEREIRPRDDPADLAAGRLLHRQREADGGRGQGRRREAGEVTSDEIGVPRSQEDPGNENLAKTPLDTVP